MKTNMKVFLPLTLLLGLFALVFSEGSCPPEDQIRPCDCISGYKPITYKCSKILDQETMEDVFKRSLDFPVNAVIWDHSSLNYVSTPLINSKNVSTVAIYHSRFTSLFTSPPNETNVIQNIILKNVTFIRGLNFGLFKNLNGLSILQIEWVIIKRVGKEFVENVSPSVRRITMDQAKIKTLHDEAFAKLTSLVALSLYGNSIKEIKRSMFPQETAINSIDLSRNQIEIIPNDMFSNMDALTDVYLKANKIKTFSYPVWGKVFKHLEYVYLDDNPIVCDCKLKWYTTESRSVKVTGTCAVPANKKGWNLIQLTQGDFHYCPK